jgi:esterase/lipase superfamily enzyme
VLSKTCKRATLYASSKDKALKASRALHNNILRAGQSGEDMVIVNGIDTVDASGVDTDLLGHGYFAATAPLINDIFQLIKSGASPEDRNLKRNTLDNKVFWKFPKGL